MRVHGYVHYKSANRVYKRAQSPGLWIIRARFAVCAESLSLPDDFEGGGEGGEVNTNEYIQIGVGSGRSPSLASAIFKISLGVMVSTKTGIEKPAAI